MNNTDTVIKNNFMIDGGALCLSQVWWTATETVPPSPVEQRLAQFLRQIIFEDCERAWCCYSPS